MEESWHSEETYSDTGYHRTMYMINGSDKEQRLVVGVDTSLDLDCFDTPQTVMHCEVLLVQLAIYFVRMMMPNGFNGSVLLQIYPTLGALMNDLVPGVVDVYPFELAAYPQDIDGSYHMCVVGATLYVLYSSARGLQEPLDESPVQFLIAPFAMSVWYCAAGFAALIALLSPLLWLSGRRRRLPDRGQPLVILAFSFLFTVYSSHLKALLTQPSTSVPFVNLYDLARKLERGKKILVVEDQASLRWTLFTSDNIESIPEVNAVHLALRSSPWSLVYEPNMTRICQLLDKDPRYVFLSYEEQIHTYCPDLCPWKYELHEYPNTPTVFAVAKSSPFVKNADMAVYALENYREQLMRRRKKHWCFPHKKSIDLIGIKSLKGALYCLFSAWLVSFIAFLIERYAVNRFQLQKYFRFWRLLDQFPQR